MTLNMAGNMGLIPRKCFPIATRVIDHFHAQKLTIEALKEIIIKYRQTDQKQPKQIQILNLKILLNSYTPKQLLVRITISILI